MRQPLGSIRARLLFWYALILLAVIGTYTAVLYEKAWAEKLERVDHELRFHANALHMDFKDEPWEWANEFRAERRREWRHDTIGRERYSGGGKEMFLPYAMIWDAHGKLVFDTGLPPRVFHSHDAGKIDPPPDSLARTCGEYREVALKGGYGVVVLVGRILQREREQMREFLRMMMVAGALAMGVAFVGGSFLVGRVVAPIARMTEAASSISATDLSRRIDVARTESELGRLAETLNEAFDRLEAAFARQTRFTADASHELRTPLSILMAQVELAMKRERTVPEYQETLTTCLSAARRMKGVVEGLLTLARADAGEARVEKASCDLGEIVGETVRMLAPVAFERQVTVRQEIGAARVTGDRNLLREMVTNLLTNAVSYNRPGGAVDVLTREDGDAAILQVKDTGVGIPAADTPHVFERFYRVDKARSREMGGSGLGLSITKWIVGLHGGQISFVSREGVGTTFTVRLPRDAASPVGPPYA